MSFGFGTFGYGLAPFGAFPAAPLAAPPANGGNGKPIPLGDFDYAAFGFPPAPPKPAPPKPEEKKPEPEEKKPEPAPEPPKPDPNLKFIQDVIEASNAGAKPAGAPLDLADVLDFVDWLREKKRRNNLARLIA